MFVSKWFVMIGVEFIRDAAPLDCLLERHRLPELFRCSLVFLVQPTVFVFNQARLSALTVRYAATCDEPITEDCAAGAPQTGSRVLDRAGLLPILSESSIDF